MSEQITYSVDGLDSEHGHVAFGDFLDRLEHLLAALNGIDRLVGQTGNPKLYYRIVKASHSSPLTITLQPVLKDNRSGESRNHIRACHSRFFREMNAVRRMEPVSPDIEPELLEHFRDLALGVGQDFKRAAISNTEEAIEIDKAFEINASKLTTEENVSFGSFEGRLDAANIHGEAKRFWLYP